jgi:hypothetical protein
VGSCAEGGKLHKTRRIAAHAGTLSARFAAAIPNYCRSALGTTRPCLRHRV